MYFYNQSNFSYQVNMLVFYNVLTTNLTFVSKDNNVMYGKVVLALHSSK